MLTIKDGLFLPLRLSCQESSTFLTKPLFNSLCDPFGSPSRGQKPQEREDVAALLCYICPTCPSPAGGSLILNQAFPLTIKGKDVAGSAIAPPEFWYRQRSLCPKGLPMSAYATELRLFVG